MPVTPTGAVEGRWRLLQSTDQEAGQQLLSSQAYQGLERMFLEMEAGTKRCMLNQYPSSQLA